MIDWDLFSPSRIRLVRQTEVAECGIASLTMIAAYHGLDVDLGTMRRRFEPSLRGTSMRTLLEISNQLGLAPRAVKASLDHLSNLHVPAILHWNLNHYVVLERVRKGRALVHDPNGRSLWMPIEEISNHFTGIALELRPTSTFVRGSARRRLRVSELWSQISGLQSALTQTFLLSLVLQILSLVAPYYLQIAVDTALPAFDNNLLTVLALGFGLVAFISASTTLLRALSLLHAGTNVAVGLTSNVARRLFRLPIRWFETRHTGDILSRLQSVGPLQKMLTEDAVVAMVDGVLAAFTFLVMLYYSATLAIISLLAFGLHCLLRVLTYTAQREAEEAKVVAAGHEQTTQLETLRGIRTVRLFNREALRYSIWLSRFIDVTNADIRLARISIWRATASFLVYSLENIISIWLAITLVMKGVGFSLGMMFAYMAYKTLFIKNSEALIDRLMRYRMLDLHLARLSDIAHADEDDSFNTAIVPNRNIDGKIELKEIYYRYSLNDPWVINGANAVFEKGQHVAITGPSGGGKSTLIKILTGLLTPSSGEVLVDGIAIANFGLRNYQAQIAVVLQEDSLFGGSLAENIAFFEENIEMEAIVACSKAAAIHDDIAAMPMQYETLVGDMGSTLSGGQKQRLLLARALYRKPRILIMDEGTAHLDAKNEVAVQSAIREMGITRVSVAHRKETVDAASRVFVMNGGTLTETQRVPN